MMRKEEVERWLQTLDPGTVIGIGEDGLTLETDGEPYIEVGMLAESEPEPEPEPGQWGCPHCRSLPADVVQDGRVGAAWGGQFDERGEWEDDEDGATMFWDCIDIDGYRCRDCGETFDKPARLGPVE